ncbi:MAG: radical SAM protein [Spirochaetales bacterium]|nr:radical SAM protein [Spirochaetales bacterium]
MFDFFKQGKKNKQDSTDSITWNPRLIEQFEAIIKMTPVLFRKSARAAVTETAEDIAKNRGATQVEECDLVNAYLKETPEMFKESLFENALKVGIDMASYLSEKRLNKMKALSTNIAWDQVEQVFHPDVTWFEWAVTQKCNLRCRYCFENAGTASQDELSTKAALSIVHSLGASAKKLNRRFVMLWSGGEPLLREDIFELIGAAREEGMLCTMASNGSFITPEMAQRLKDAEVSTVIITLDSLTPDIHDAARGKGSHAEALRGIHNAKAAGLLTMVESVATRHNYKEVTKLRKWAEKEGFLYFHRPLHRGGRTLTDDSMMNRKQYHQLYFDRYQHIFEKLKTGKGTHIPLFEIFDLVPFPYKPLTREERDYLEWGVGCQACRLIHGISVSGDLLPCIRLKMPLGNLLTETFETIAQTPLYRRFVLRQDRGGICKSCEHLELCGGGCLAETMALEGDPFAGWERCCWVTKE